MAPNKISQRGRGYHSMNPNSSQTPSLSIGGTHDEDNNSPSMHASFPEGSPEPSSNGSGGVAHLNTIVPGSSSMIPPTTTLEEPSIEGDPRVPTKFHITNAIPGNPGWFAGDQNNKITRKLGKCIQPRWTKSWMTWTEVPVETRDLIYQEFSTYCTWPASIEPSVRETFETKAAAGVTNWFCKYRTRNKKPGKWMPEHVWKELQKKWQTDPTFLKRSIAGKANREGALSHMALHTQGSTPHLTVKQKLIEQGEDALQSKLFKICHMKKNKEEFVNARAKDTYQKLMDKLAELKQSQQSEDGFSEVPPIDEEELYASIVGEKNGRIYGMGPEAKMLQARRASSAHSIGKPGMHSHDHVLAPQVEIIDRITVMESNLEFAKEDVQKTREDVEKAMKGISSLESSFAQVMEYIKSTLGSSSRKEKKKKRKRLNNGKAKKVHLGNDANEDGSISLGSSS